MPWWGWVLVVVGALVGAGIGAAVVLYAIGNSIRRSF